MNQLPQDNTPDHTAWWQSRLAEITDPEGEIAEKAGGDENYQRFLEEEAVAALAAEVAPDRPELRGDLERKSEVRRGYEVHVLGVEPPEWRQPRQVLVAFVTRELLPPGADPLSEGSFYQKEPTGAILHEAYEAAAGDPGLYAILHAAQIARDDVRRAQEAQDMVAAAAATRRLGLAGRLERLYRDPSTAPLNPNELTELLQRHSTTAHGGQPSERPQGE